MSIYRFSSGRPTEISDSSGPLCATCKQEVADVPKSAAQDFKVYCSERCRPSTSDGLLSVPGRFDHLKLRGR